MHILIVADGRSPITHSWIKMVTGLGWRVSLVSTFPCEAVSGAELAGILPVGFSALGGGQVKHRGRQGRLETPVDQPLQAAGADHARVPGAAAAGALPKAVHQNCE